MVAIFGVLAADQAAKRLLLSGAVDLNGTELIPGVANVAFAWNRGVSFSLLWQNSDLGSLLLSAGAACIVAALLVWAFRTRRAGVAVAIGLIIGGALGNLVDRYLYGAVFDFLVIRLGETRLQFGRYSDHAWHIWPQTWPAASATSPEFPASQGTT
jgi:lipoprotein signal peptidase